jgi:hypothetical protein
MLLLGMIMWSKLEKNDSRNLAKKNRYGIENKIRTIENNKLLKEQIIL